MRFTKLHLLALCLATASPASAQETGPSGAPALDPRASAQPILFVVRRQYAPDHHNTATLFQRGEVNAGKFAGGSALKVLDLRRGGAVRTLVECPRGVVRDPEVSFDGRRVVFAMRRGPEEDYHIWEIGADGGGLRQLTSAPGVSDIDPLYLSDGSIVFSSTREPKYCMCNQHIMANLFRMESDGANIHQIGKSTLFEGHAALMPDGRILYDRWEYVDRNFGDAQGLWSVYPDGSGHALYWGNNTNSPGGVIDGRILPDGQRVLCIFGSCHDRPWGALAIVDRRLGLDGRAAVVRTWPASAIDLVGKGNWDTFKRVRPRYEDPWPLGEDLFLCARTIGAGEATGIYLVDARGGERLLHAEPPGCFDPMPLGPRPRPARIPPRVDLARKSGEIYVLDVYRGTHMRGVARGTVKALRVVESPEKRAFTNPAWNGQGVHRPAMNWHDFSNKRILGTVPVEEDGSVYLRLPAGRFVYFQLLDAEGMMVQSMRSGTIVQPGERSGCAGCHEERRSAPPPTGGTMPLALRRAPSRLSGWYGPARLFSYRREVQPVLERACVRCHDYGTPGGEVLNLAPDRTLTFNTSYNELWRKGYIKAIGAGPAQIQLPYAWGSHASRLVALLRAGHEGVALAREDFARIVTWIDINAPYYPRYESAWPRNLAGRAPLSDGQLRRLGELTGVPFAKLAGFKSNRGPQVSFARPALSPCLDSLRKRGGRDLAEALAILRAGATALRERGRADGDHFLMCEPNRRADAKYARREEAEQRARAALLGGTKIHDGAARRAADFGSGSR